MRLYPHELRSVVNVVPCHRHCSQLYASRPTTNASRSSTLALMRRRTLSRVSPSTGAENVSNASSLVWTVGRRGDTASDTSWTLLSGECLIFDHHHTPFLTWHLSYRHGDKYWAWIFWYDMPQLVPLDERDIYSSGLATSRFERWSMRSRWSCGRMTRRKTSSRSTSHGQLVRHLEGMPVS